MFRFKVFGFFWRLFFLIFLFSSEFFANFIIKKCDKCGYIEGKKEGFVDRFIQTLNEIKGFRI
ncbi:hypothetical protein AXY43_12860 [Clostridium sp. MF28]|jgi:hypothetical protein|uniref:Uncharacterized protein n=1 Tax=Clostridium diolis TaxID=223919 RepID=A0AAV3W3B7_9CLOT|nr:hypothetical protein [Clostridium beijerinckii]AVK48842.1 hypothetical protein AXY43_12860 [Clostridium sp. MF28]OVE66439.1 hypothetical protein CCS79_18875 [Clostridium diolis]ALB43945.1 hypothetical protein X276_00905 [Clostridium beijerinckii NRRL B-598]PSM56528.1 hypothetical protein C4L39_17065 [Clostridium diolis]GEA32795.1 hypothetical protein CDIOL_37180 [Clostridium diolis]